MNKDSILDVPLADALTMYHDWDEHTRSAYLHDIPRDDVLMDHYHHLRYRKPKVPLVHERSVHVHNLHRDKVPGFSDVYAVGCAGQVFFRFRCGAEATLARVIKACGNYGVEVRYV